MDLDQMFEVEKLNYYYANNYVKTGHAIRNKKNLNGSCVYNTGSMVVIMKNF